MSSTDPTPVIDAPDDERMTREFGAVTPPPEVLAAAGDLAELFEDSTHSGPPPKKQAEPETPPDAPKQEGKP